MKYADEVIVLSKGVQDYFKEIYGRRNIYWKSCANGNAKPWFASPH